MATLPKPPARLKNGDINHSGYLPEAQTQLLEAQAVLMDFHRLQHNLIVYLADRLRQIQRMLTVQMEAGSVAC